MTSLSLFACSFVFSMCTLARGVFFSEILPYFSLKQGATFVYGPLKASGLDGYPAAIISTRSLKFMHALTLFWHCYPQMLTSLIS